jgi:hypothetical protein
LLGGGIAGLAACDVGAGAAGCDAGGCEDRLKGELKLVLGKLGEATCGAGAGFGGETGVELANPPKSSAANRSTGIDVADGFGCGAVPS